MTRMDHPLPAYYQTAIGRMVRHLIGRKLKPVMKSAYPEHHHDLDVAALGYARPYLKYFSDHYPHLINLQTIAGEITPWPPAPRLPRRQARVDEHQLPLLDASLDLLLVMHCFETAAVPKDMADELWRVLKGQGKLVLVVPHRSSCGQDVMTPLLVVASLILQIRSNIFCKITVLTPLKSIKPLPPHHHNHGFTPAMRLLLNVCPTQWVVF